VDQEVDEGKPRFYYSRPARPFAPDARGRDTRVTRPA